ncbi:MAG: hypothetical protein AAFW75_30680, partial [Cyanobacteria bacterium J06636_16]
MTISPEPDREPTISDVLEVVQGIREDLEQTRQELREEVERWDERFFQFTRDNLAISRIIIVT